MSVDTENLNTHEQRYYQGQALMQAQIAIWKKHPELLKQAERKYQEYLMPREEIWSYIGSGGIQVKDWINKCHYAPPSISFSTTG